MRNRFVSTRKQRVDFLARKMIDGDERAKGLWLKEMKKVTGEYA